MNEREIEHLYVSGAGSIFGMPDTVIACVLTVDIAEAGTPLEAYCRLYPICLDFGMDCKIARMTYQLILQEEVQTGLILTRRMADRGLGWLWSLRLAGIGAEASLCLFAGRGPDFDLCSQPKGLFWLVLLARGPLSIFACGPIGG